MIKSKNSEILKDALSRSRIKFEEEYNFNGSGLRFDFAIFSGSGVSKEEFILAIEYDGEQHYTDKSLFGDTDLKERDELKNQWCYQNNVILVRLREVDFSTPEKILEFVTEKLVPALPQDSFLPSTEDISDFDILNSGKRTVEISEIIQDSYSIRELSSLMNYSPSYINNQIKNFGWFKNWSGKSNLTISPYYLDVKDVLRGLANLGFLMDSAGKRVPPLDDSHLSEIVSEMKAPEVIRDRVLLVCNKKSDEDDATISTVEVLTNPDLGLLVRKVLSDEFCEVIYINSDNIELTPDNVDVIKNTCYNVNCNIMFLK